MPRPIVDRSTGHEIDVIRVEKVDIDVIRVTKGATKATKVVLIVLHLYMLS